MKWSVIVIFSFLAGLGVAADDPNGYKVVVGHNFVNAVPPADENGPQPAVALPVLTVNGISALHGALQAAFKVIDASGERSYVLGRGEEREDIHVEAIDENAGTVTFRNHGKIQKIELEQSAPAVTQSPAPSVSTVASAPVVLPPSAPVRQSQPDMGPGASVVVIGHRDPPPHINGIASADVPPGGGGGAGGFLMSTNASGTNMVGIPNTNAFVRFARPGQLNPGGQQPVTIPPSTARIPPPPTVPGGAGSGASVDAGGSATTGVQGPPPSAQPTPAPMPTSPSRSGR